MSLQHLAHLNNLTSRALARASGASPHKLAGIMRVGSPWLRTLAVTVTMIALSAFRLEAQSSGSTKPDTTKASKPSTKKAPSKAPAKPPAKPPTTTSPKPTTTTTKPSTTKAPAPGAATAPTGTTAKPASGATTARPGATGATSPRPSSASSSTAGAARKPAAEVYNTVGVYAGGATAGLGFGAGPSGGLVWRRKTGGLPLAFRGDISVARFTQSPVTASGTALEDASLLHAGASLGLEWVFARGHTARPYLTASGGVYRFQASGPAGNNSTIPNAVYTSTTDVALLAGAGIRLGQRLFLEARVVTVGDFQSIPFVLGVHF